MRPAKRAVACGAAHKRPALPKRLRASSEGMPHDINATILQVVSPHKHWAAAETLQGCLLSVCTEDKRTGLTRK